MNIDKVLVVKIHAPKNPYMFVICLDSKTDEEQCGAIEQHGLTDDIEGIIKETLQLVVASGHTHVPFDDLQKIPESEYSQLLKLKQDHKQEIVRGDYGIGQKAVR